MKRNKVLVLLHVVVSSIILSNERQKEFILQ